MMMCYNFFVGMCSRCSELIHQYYHDVIITINQIGGYGGKENKRKK
jgi:hypothetical protein